MFKWWMEISLVLVSEFQSANPFYVNFVRIFGGHCFGANHGIQYLKC